MEIPFLPLLPVHDLLCDQEGDLNTHHKEHHHEDENISFLPKLNLERSIQQFLKLPSAENFKPIIAFDYDQCLNQKAVNQNFTNTFQLVKGDEEYGKSMQPCGLHESCVFSDYDAQHFPMVDDIEKIFAFVKRVAPESPIVIVSRNPWLQMVKGTLENVEVNGKPISAHIDGYYAYKEHKAEHFSRLMADYKCEPKDICFFDDSATNIEIAQKLGISSMKCVPGNLTLNNVFDCLKNNLLKNNPQPTAHLEAPTTPTTPTQPSQTTKIGNSIIVNIQAQNVPKKRSEILIQSFF